VRFAKPFLKESRRLVKAGKRVLCAVASEPEGRKPKGD